MSEYDDIWQESTGKEWVRQVLDDMAPKMADSALVAQLVPDAEKFGAGDVKWWVELGASIMMDKPIIAIIMPDQKIPEKLRLIADEIVVLADGVTPEGSRDLRAAFARVLGDADE